jgi:hypothetical protein
LDEQIKAFEGGHIISDNTASATPRPPSSTSFVSAISHSINAIDNEGSRSPSSTAASVAKGESKDLEKAEETGQAQPLDPNIVDWDGPDDPNMALNWSKKKKWGTVTMLSALTFVTY